MSMESLQRSRNLDGISCTSKSPLLILFEEATLQEGSDKEKLLCKNVKKVVEIIVGLLMDKVYRP